MSINETEARIRARIWQSLAQSNLDVSSLERTTLEALVQLVTDAALIELDSEIGVSLQREALVPQTSQTDQSLDEKLNDEDEDLLWEGRPFLSLTLFYKITDERILIREGLFGKATENIELIRVQDISYNQSFGERLLNIGDVTIRSHDTSHPTFMLKNVTNPQEVHEILRRAVLHARKKHNFTYREEM